MSLYDVFAKEIFEACFIAGFSEALGRKIVRDDKYEKQFAIFWEEYGEDFKENLKVIAQEEK